MAVSPWPVGTDSGQKARDALIAYIGAQITANRVTLPRQHYGVIGEGAREGGKVIVRVVTKADPQLPWPHIENGHRVIEDWHRVGVFVKADQKRGKAEAVSAVASLLRNIFFPAADSPHLAALSDLGLYMLDVRSDGFVSDPDGEDAEICKQELQLRFNTDTFLS